MFRLVVVCSLLVWVLPTSPPLFDYAYNVPFNYSCVRKGIPYHTQGHLFYDGVKRKERIDLENGRHEFFCGSIRKGVDSRCRSVTIGTMRWYIHLDEEECCLCCDKHVCGILRPDWLQKGDYHGMTLIDDVYYDVWHHTGFTSEDYLYVTRDSNQYPRRLSESGNPIFDYDLKKF